MKELKFCVKGKIPNKKGSDSREELQYQQGEERRGERDKYANQGEGEWFV
jgi:hypothetical protein